MSPKFLDRFTSGLLAGAVFAFAIAWILDSDVAEGIKDNWLQFATILGAIIGALLALIGPNRQIEHQNFLNEQERKDNLAAERATLPLALSRICEICEKGVQEQVGLKHVMKGKLTETSLVLDGTHIESLKATIKLTKGPTRDCLQAILRNYQPTHAMHDDFLADTEIALKGKEQYGYNRISIAYRWSLIYALANMSFDFARGKSGSIDTDFSGEDVLRAACLSGVVPDMFEDFVGFFERTAKRDSSKPISDVD